MKLIAPGLWQLQFLWPHAFNVFYVQGDGEGIIVDASIRWAWPMVKRQLRGRPLTAVVLTHAHPDHQGCAAKITEHFGVPLWCHEADADSAEGRAPLVRQSAMWERLGNLAWAGPRSPVSRRLRAGDRVAGFTVHHLPGHTRGSIALLRESDRVILAGDIVNSNDHLMGIIKLLREPPRAFSESPAQNREAIRALCALRPSLVCTGHGPPVRDMGQLERFAERMIPELEHYSADRGEKLRDKASHFACSGARATCV